MVCRVILNSKNMNTDIPPCQMSPSTNNSSPTTTIRAQNAIQQRGAYTQDRLRHGLSHNRRHKQPLTRMPASSRKQSSDTVSRSSGSVDGLSRGASSSGGSPALPLRDGGHTAVTPGVSRLRRGALPRVSTAARWPGQRLRQVGKTRRVPAFVVETAYRCAW